MVYDNPPTYEGSYEDTEVLFLVFLFSECVDINNLRSNY